MAKVNIQDKNIDALKVDIKQKRDELFKMKLDHARRKLKNTSSLTLARKEIAKMLTVMKQRGVTNG